METLISMTDFVIAMREDKDKDNIRSFWSCEKYARFLKQPLQLWMFVPCDLEGNALEEKKPFQDKYYEYQQAKERCLFEGFSEKDAKIALFANETIEELIEFNLTLTKTAKNQIGL